MIDRQGVLQSALGGDLLKYLLAQPLYELCCEQIEDACHLIDQCCLRIHRDAINSDLRSLLTRTTRSEETIFQYASTDSKVPLADWVRMYSNCDSASDREAHTAYILACAVKALEVLAEWMQATEQKAQALAVNASTIWPRDVYCEFVKMQVDKYECIEAIDQYALYLDPITSLPCLADDELRPAANQALKHAIRRKGGILSGIDRNEESSARDTAIVERGHQYRAVGMPPRHIATAVHAWLEREIAKPTNERLEWIALDTDKALTRKSVEAILKRGHVL